jgi:DNA polymerase-3 subunit delta'
MSFKNILGHSKEISILKRAISSGRVAHSYLFAGPDGVGKGLAARALAKALNCESPVGGATVGHSVGPSAGDDKVDSCGVCTSCKTMDEGFHLNLVKVEPVEGLLKIDQIRDLQNALKYRVASGRRVAIVGGADRLIKAAANAFLKTLEEPPADSIIILVTSRPAELLPTILSRCQRINFRPLPEEVVSRVLIKRLGGKDLSSEDAAMIARFAGGSLSRALEAARSGEQARRREFLERFLRLTPARRDAILDAAWDLSKDEDLEGILEFLKTWYRDLAVFNEGAGGLMVTGEASGQQVTLDDRGPGRLVRSFELIEEARRNITPPRNANKRLTMEVLLLRLVGTTAPLT